MFVLYNFNFHLKTKNRQVWTSYIIWKVQYFLNVVIVFNKVCLYHKPNFKLNIDSKMCTWKSVRNPGNWDNF